jgi:GAF domain-containing protein
LEAQREHLEDAVTERTGDLLRRTRYLETTATIARDAATVLDVQELLSRVTHLISEQFGFYHAGIFLLSPGAESLVLRAASSQGGQRMLARGHQLELGEGIVGYVAQKVEPRIALDVGEDAVFFDNPDLPETHSEMALPLTAREEVIGVLDVQSQEPEAFGEEDVAVLQTLADQVALAISNARLLRQAQESLQAERRAYGELSREAWQELVRAQEARGVIRDEHGIHPVSAEKDLEVEQALQTGQAATGGDGAKNLAMPIRVRGQVIGAIDAHKSDETAAWTPDQVALMEVLADQLGDALEDARLYEDAQRRAARDRLLSGVTSRLRETLDVDAVLRSAAYEMRQAMGLHDVTVRLGGTDRPAPAQRDEGGHS